MALKDFVKGTAENVMNVASEAVQKTSEQAKGGSFSQGILGNYSNYPAEAAYEEYGGFLMQEEHIKQAFKLVRDVMIFTDKRIIFIDKTGITGSKAKVQSINYFSIINVEVSTAGFRFDDSDLDFTYIVTPNLHALQIEYATKHLEFPRKFPVQQLYSELQAIAYENCQRLHNI